MPRKTRSLAEFLTLLSIIAVQIVVGIAVHCIGVVVIVDVTWISGVVHIYIRR